MARRSAAREELLIHCGLTIFTLVPRNLSILTLKSTPMVELMCWSKLSSVNLTRAEGGRNQSFGVTCTRGSGVIGGGSGGGGGGGGGDDDGGVFCRAEHAVR